MGIILYRYVKKTVITQHLSHSGAYSVMSGHPRDIYPVGMDIIADLMTYLLILKDSFDAWIGDYCSGLGNLWGRLNDQKGVLVRLRYLFWIFFNNPENPYKMQALYLVTYSDSAEPGLWYWLGGLATAVAAQSSDCCSSCSWSWWQARILEAFRPVFEAASPRHYCSNPA